MAWPLIIASDLLSGEPVSKGAARYSATDGEELFRRDLYILNKTTSFPFAEVNDATEYPAFGVVASKQVRIPDEMEESDTYRITVSLWNGTAGQTAYYRIYDNVGAVAGTTQSVVGVTPAWKTSVLTIAAGWPGTFRTIEIQLATTATGTAYAHAEFVMGNSYFAD